MRIVILLLILLFSCIPLIEGHDIRCVPKIKKHPMMWNYGVNEPQHYGKCINI